MIMTTAAKRLGVVALALVMALVTAGCSGAGGHGDGDKTTAPTIDRVPLAQVDPIADLKAYQGGSTATMASSELKVIADNPTPTLPVTVTDSQGTEVTITDSSRILALDIYGTLSRIVYGVGLGDNLVGRDTSSSYPEIEHLPNVTQNGHDLNGEAMLELAPTVIITDTSLGPWDVMLQMRDAGIPVVVVDSHRSMNNVGDLISQVSAALGVPEEGKQLASETATQIDAKLAEVAAIAPAAQQDKLRMVFLYVRGQAGVYYMFGEGSGAESLITALGGYDVAEEIGWTGMRPLTAEGLVDAQPDLILMMTKGLDSVGGVDGLIEQIPALAQTPAGINKRIVDMDDTDILSFGPQTADVLDALARAIYAPESL